MTQSAHYSIVIERPARETWKIVRDFNSYPQWIDEVQDSHIEDALSGTTVGAVRSFAIGQARTRQRLVAHSDAARFFTYESCAPAEHDHAGITRIMLRYRGTLRLRSISEGDRCLAEWSSRYECSEADAHYWREWWKTSLPVWLGSLRDHINGQSTAPA